MDNSLSTENPQALSSSPEVEGKQPLAHCQQAADNRQQSTDNQPQSTDNRQQATDTTKGILIVALGATEYGNMAANLAASIRFSDPDVPIHLVHTDSSISHLAEVHRALFSSMAVCPPEYYTRYQKQDTSDEQLSSLAPPTTDNATSIPLGQATGNRQQATEYIKAKTHIYELTPYDETLFLDADMLLLPTGPVSQTIAQLSAACDFTIENRGYADLSLPDGELDPAYCMWCSIVDVKHHYQTAGRFYNMHSEFIFFKKTDRNKAYFDTVREVYDTRPVAWTTFDGAVPDEYAYEIAAAITEMRPHAEPYVAIHWHGIDPTAKWNEEVIKKYIGFSLGGNIIPAWIQRKLNAYLQLYRTGLRLPYLFRVGPKKQWSKHRKKM